MPLVRIEIALQTIVDGKLVTLMVRREQAPYRDRWALPGGVIRVDRDRDLDAGAQRIALERLGITPPYLTQFCAVGSAGREPRAPHDWGLSVVYRALAPAGTIAPVAGKRVAGLRWVQADNPLPASHTAFDHALIVASAVAATRQQTAALEFPRGLIPERFTLGALQRLCEEVLGTPLDKSSFRRKLRDRKLVESIEGAQQRGEAHRPSAIYRLSSGGSIGTTPQDRLETGFA